MERRGVKISATSVLWSTFHSCSWRDLYPEKLQLNATSLNTFVLEYAQYIL